VNRRGRGSWHRQPHLPAATSRRFRSDERGSYVCIPAAVFVAIPGAVIALWLLLFWLLELLVLLVLKLHQRIRGAGKQVNKPELTMTMS
jgi:hypothetical protein